MTFGLVIKFEEVGNPSQGERPLLRRNYPEVVVLSALGAEISTKFPHIWNRVGPVWANAMLVLMGHDSEKLDEDESDSAYEEDHSYKPVYRARNLVKWLAAWLENDTVAEASVRDPLLSNIHEWMNATENPEDVPLERQLRVKSTYVKPEKPPTIYNIGILDLPSELVVDIIQLALQDDPHVVTTLSHVNSAFRKFTLSTPTLWTAIDIMFDEKRISAHLERSASAPLRVRASLTLLTMTRPQGLTKLATLIKMIREHTARIASLEMLYTNSVWGKVALHYFAKLGTLPNLDKFEYGLLLHQHFQGDGNLRARCKPRRISFEALTIKAFRELYSERVISLKVAKCKEIGMTDWEAALRSMPSLQRLEISDFKIGDPDPGEGAGFGNKISLISLLHLQTLSLIRVPRAALIILLEALQTPNLISATISFLEPDGLRDHSTPAPKLKPQPTYGLSDAALLPFVTANPQLRELDVHNCCMTPDMWTAVFAQLQDLNKLRIASSDVTTEALMSLVASSGSLPALPSLTHLTLDNESLDEESGLFFSIIDVLITTRWFLFQQQQASGAAGQTQIQALKSVVLRGWNESQIPTTYETTEFARLRGLVEHLQLETVREASDDGEATDGEWESLSELSWSSGDQAVVDLGDGLQRVEWGMEQIGGTDDGNDTDDLEDWVWDDDETSSLGLSEDSALGDPPLNDNSSLDHNPSLDHNSSLNGTSSPDHNPSLQDNSAINHNPSINQNASLDQNASPDQNTSLDHNLTLQGIQLFAVVLFLILPALLVLNSFF